MLGRQKKYIYFAIPAIDGRARNCYDKSVSKRENPKRISGKEVFPCTFPLMSGWSF